MPSGMNDEMEPTSEGEAKSLDLVQRLTVSVLVGGIVGFVASVLALYVASRGRADLPRDSQLGLWAMTGVIGLLGAAGVLLLNRQKPWHPAIVLGLTPMIVAGPREAAGVGFCFARMFHPAMRHVGPTRSELGIPTVFNILGPLSHPGGVTRQVLGVADPARVDVIAEVLRQRGMKRAMVVHGHDGLDELTTTDRTLVIDIVDGEVSRREIDPADVGLERRTVDDIAVGDPAANAEVARRVLGGELSAHRDIVVFNAAAGLVVADIAGDLADGVILAAAAIDDGRAAATLDRLVAASNASTT